MSEDNKSIEELKGVFSGQLQDIKNLHAEVLSKTGKQKDKKEDTRPWYKRILE